jgi:hypothetical protein
VSALLRLASMAAAFAIVIALLAYAALDALRPDGHAAAIRGNSGAASVARAARNPGSTGPMPAGVRPATVLFLICDGEGISRTVYNGTAYEPDISFSLPSDHAFIAAILRGETSIPRDAEVVESACFREARLAGRIDASPQ